MSTQPRSSRAPAAVVITASSALQYSFEGSTPTGEASQSVFTKHLVEGLESGAADLDGDGRITVDELYRYVHDNVVRENPQQRPNISIETQGVVVVAHSRAGVRPVELSYLLLSALASPLSRVRLAAVDELGTLLLNRDVWLAAAARACSSGSSTTTAAASPSEQSSSSGDPRSPSPARTSARSTRWLAVAHSRRRSSSRTGRPCSRRLRSSNRSALASAGPRRCSGC